MNIKHWILFFLCVNLLICASCASWMITKRDGSIAVRVLTDRGYTGGCEPLVDSAAP